MRLRAAFGIAINMPQIFYILTVCAAISISDAADGHTQNGEGQQRVGLCFLREQRYRRRLIHSVMPSQSAQHC